MVKIEMRKIIPALLAALLLVEHPTVSTEVGFVNGLNHRQLHLGSTLQLRGGISKEAAEVGEN